MMLVWFSANKLLLPTSLQIKPMLTFNASYSPLSTVSITYYLPWYILFNGIFFTAMLGALIYILGLSKQQQLALFQTHRKIDMIHQGAKIISDTQDFKTSIKLCIELICKSINWDAGHAYIIDDASKNKLVPLNVWYMKRSAKLQEFHDVTKKTSFPLGKGLPGRVWEQKSSIWIANIHEDDNFPRAKKVVNLPLKGAIGFPIILNGNVVAVMEFFQSHVMRHDEALLSSIKALSEQLSRSWERKLVLNELKESEQRSRLLLEAAGEGIYGLDSNGNTTFVNPAARRMLGYQANELIGKKMHALVHHSYPDGSTYPRTKCPMYATVSSGKVNRVTNEVLWRKDGTSFPVEYTSTPIYEGELSVGAVVTFNDISERKAVDKEKNEFISCVSHELRTPLTSIRGSLGLILGSVTGNINEKTRSMLIIANNNCNRLIRLINDILDSEKINLGKMQLKKELLDINDVIKLAIQYNEAYALEFNVNLECSIKSQDNTLLFIDKDRILQVLTNLISNAIKFSNSNGTVTIKNTVLDDEVCIEVIDEGEGVPESFHSKIFKNFSQADNSSSRSKGGTGLGLSIAKSIVELHQGQLKFSSVLGEGSRFYFTLPLQ